MIHFEFEDGATPLDADAQEGLIPSGISTRGELDEYEHLNILEALNFAFGKKHKIENILTIEFVKNLHKRMFSNIWSWAGSFRTKELNMGTDWIMIVENMQNALENAKYSLETFPDEHDKTAVNLHVALVRIHPFLNGNGRHARLMADILITTLGKPIFSWGNKILSKKSEVRDRYIGAVRLAINNKDLNPVIDFARS